MNDDDFHELLADVRHIMEDTIKQHLRAYVPEDELKQNAERLSGLAIKGVPSVECSVEFILRLIRYIGVLTAQKQEQVECIADLLAALIYNEIIYGGNAPPAEFRAQRILAREGYSMDVAGVMEKPMEKSK